MRPSKSFVTPEEQRVIEEFLEVGYIVRPVDDAEALDSLRAFVVETVCAYLGAEVPEDHGEFLDKIFEQVTPENLNPLRLHVFRTINEQDWLRPTYYRIARSTVDLLVGNELAMQNKVNLSIQMPEDDSSLLGIHSDAFGGDSPYQVVEWLPLVDVFGTKSMFILPKAKNDKLVPELTRYEHTGFGQLYDDVEDDLTWVNVPYGHVLVFTPNQLHGNVLNREGSTRWSLNCRLTGLFTPYYAPEKKLGSYYLPITVRPVTRIGASYEEPKGFTE